MAEEWIKPCSGWRSCLVLHENGNGKIQQDSHGNWNPNCTNYRSNNGNGNSMYGNTTGAGSAILLQTNINTND